MGALGPRRVVIADAGPTPPPPYRVVDNAYSLLDKTDLVMIDPVGTGLSRAVGEAKDKDFWGVDPDIESIAPLHRPVRHRQQPLELAQVPARRELRHHALGAAIVDYLQSADGMAFNGVVLISVAIDLEADLRRCPATTSPIRSILPTYAATAWYHHALPKQPGQRSSHSSTRCAGSPRRLRRGAVERGYAHRRGARRRWPRRSTVHRPLGGIS